MQTVTSELPPELNGILDSFLAQNAQPTFLFRTLDANAHTMPVQGSDGVTNAVPWNASRTIPGSTLIRTSDGRRHNLLYAVGEDRENHNGVLMVVPRPAAITFDPKEFCVKTVRRTERELLARLLFSNECRNGLNPSKEETERGYVYELVEAAKTAEKRVIDQERVLDTKIAVRQASDTEVKLACERLSLPVHADRNENAAALYAAAETDPEGVFRVLGDEWEKTTALVRDLTTAGIIVFDDAARTYRTVSNQQAFHNVLTGNFEQSLIKYLSDTQGQKTKTALARLLEEKGKKKK